MQINVPDDATVLVFGPRADPLSVRRITSRLQPQISAGWAEALAALWREEGAKAFVKTTSQLCDWLEEYGVPDVPHPQSPKVPHFLEEIAPTLEKLGIKVLSRRTSNFRGYEFRGVDRAKARA